MPSSIGGDDGYVGIGVVGGDMVSWGFGGVVMDKGCAFCVSVDMVLEVGGTNEVFLGAGGEKNVSFFF